VSSTIAPEADNLLGNPLPVAPSRTFVQRTERVSLFDVRPSASEHISSSRRISVAECIDRPTRTYTTTDLRMSHPHFSPPRTKLDLTLPALLLSRILPSPPPPPTPQF
jgi:hypothetical protein